jgi:hypothetical protein
VDGVRSGTCRVREEIVGRTSSTLGAHRIHTVCGGGSSRDFSRTLTAWSVRRSASSTTMTCHGPLMGDIDDRITRSRASSTR